MCVCVCKVSSYFINFLSCLSINALLNFFFQVKEEPPDILLSPSQGEVFDPDLRVKEEGEGDTLRQLMALETAAGAGMADDDGEVVCTGESTRLTAHMPDTNKTTTHTAQVYYFNISFTDASRTKRCVPPASYFFLHFNICMCLVYYLLHINIQVSFITLGYKMICV